MKEINTNLRRNKLIDRMNFDSGDKLVVNRSLERILHVSHIENVYLSGGAGRD